MRAVWCCVANCLYGTYGPLICLILDARFGFDYCVSIPVFLIHVSVVTTVYQFLPS